MLGHPHCDNNYATLFLECWLWNYVIMQQSSIQSDNMSKKLWTIKMLTTFTRDHLKDIFFISNIILDFVSSKKETVESQLYLNYFVSVAILEVYILHWENTKISNTVDLVIFARF